jgi:hypothetical protein
VLRNTVRSVNLTTPPSPCCLLTFSESAPAPLSFPQNRKKNNFFWDHTTYAFELLHDGPSVLELRKSPFNPLGIRIRVSLTRTPWKSDFTYSWSEYLLGMDPVHRIELPSGDARSPCLCYISPHISLNLSSFPQTVELVEHCRHSCGLVLQIIDSFSIFPAMRNSMLVHISKAYAIRLHLGIYPCGVVRRWDNLRLGGPQTRQSIVTMLLQCLKKGGSSS